MKQSLSKKLLVTDYIDLNCIKIFGTAFKCPSNTIAFHLIYPHRHSSIIVKLIDKTTNKLIEEWYPINNKIVFFENVTKGHEYNFEYRIISVIGFGGQDFTNNIYAIFRN